jgi:hypothetical protein
VAELRKAHSDASSQALLDRFDAALKKAQWIVADLVPQPAPRATLDEYRAIAAEAIAVVLN